jgi:hypothetical protein
MKHPKLATALRGFLTGGGEMARAIAVKDWSKTPLGPIEDWPDNLRATLAILLPSNEPAALAWDLILPCCTTTVTACFVASGIPASSGTISAAAVRRLAGAECCL